MSTRNNNFDRINDKNLEQCVVTFLEKVDSMERSKRESAGCKNLLPPQAEMRTLELWRSIISECLASFLYVFIVCGAASTSASAGSFPQTAFVTAAASGFTIAVLTYCFQHLSGAHVNPAISVAMAVTRKISPLRSVLFVAAQLGGAIAGAALLYGVSVPAHYGNINATISQIPTHMLPWEKCTIEFVLTFLVMLAYCAVTNGHQKWLGSSAVCIGFAYLVAGLVSMPSLNPARSFGPAFVMNRWEHHWVFWLGPCCGGIVAALVHEVIFIAHKRKSRSDMSVDGDSISIRSEADTYDELEKQRTSTLRSMQRSIHEPPYHRQIVNHNGNSCCTSIYRPTSYKTERMVDPIYEGSRSLYTRSPQLIRANLSRSQSVYSKSNSGGPGQHVIQRELPVRTAAHLLPPSQSMYPLSSSTNNVSSNQNNQNQQRQGADGIYGSRNTSAAAVGRSDRDIYMKRTDPIYNSVKKQDTSGNNCNNDTGYSSSYHSGSSSSGSKSTPVHSTSRKDNHHQIGMSSTNHNITAASYYHGQPSPNMPY